jgi:hypothetical protein
VIGVAAVLLVAGVAAAWLLLTRPPGPEETARAYLDALATGDGERAASLLLGPDDARADRGGALASASERLSDPVVRSVEALSGERARATVGFVLDGESRSAAFGLVEQEGRWLVAADALGELTASTTLGDAVVVGDVRLPTDTTAALFPAVCTIEASPPGIVDGDARAVVLPGEATVAAVEASVSPRAERLAQRRIDEYAQQCARTATEVPDRCGLRVPWGADLTRLDSVSFRIEQMPRVALSPDLRVFAATDGIVVATARGTAWDGATRSFTYRADDWALRGTIALTEDGMQLAVD